MEKYALFLLFILLSASAFALDASRAPTLTVPVAEQPVIQAVCPSAEQIETDVAACKASGDDSFVGTDSYGCKYVKCIEVCPSSESIEKMIAACPDSYRKYQDRAGCTQIACPTLACPDLSESIAKCKAQGLDYNTYVVSDGCKAVKCVSVPASITCKKIVTAGCAIITCDDGYSFNSCSCVKSVPVVSQTTRPSAVIGDKSLDQMDPQPEPPAQKDFDQATQLNPQPEPPAPKDADQLTQLNPQPEPPAPEDTDQATQLNPQPEPPAPKGFFSWLKGLFR